MGDCPDEQAWLDFLDPDGENGLEPRALDAHLAGCADCRALVILLAGQPSESAPASIASTHSTSTNADVSGAIEELHSLVGTHDDRRIGTRVAGKWEVEALLGAGGMGRVYRARHRNGHRVAIKFLHASLVAGNPDVVRRFRREGYTANSVGHPAIVRVLDDGDDDEPYLVMELLDGVSCRTKLAETGPFAVPYALDVIEAAAEALAAAHRAGIVHRDVKPDNVFATTSGQIRLLDFGLASIRSAVSAESATVDGVTVGTVGYMSPEQARGDNASVTARSDVWSLAATCVALLSGRPIHDGKTPAEQLAYAVTRPAPPVRSFGANLPGSIANVLDRALSFDPAERQADAGEFLAELRRARAGRPSRRMASFAMPIAGLLISAASVAVVSRKPRNEVERSPTADSPTPNAEVLPPAIPSPVLSATNPPTPVPSVVSSVVVSTSGRPARSAVPSLGRSFALPPVPSTSAVATPPDMPPRARDPLSPRF